MSSLSEKIRSTTSDSSLLPDEQHSLLVILEQSPLDETQQSELAEIAQEHDWFIPYLYVNYSAKRYALAKNDMSLYQKVVAHEVSMLENLEEQEAK